MPNLWRGKMNKHEYKVKLEAIKREASEAERALMTEYATSNSTVKIGDIVDDTLDRVKVDTIETYLPSVANPHPSCVYSGVKYTRSLKPFKNGERIRIFQNNMTSTIKGNI